MPLTYPPDSGFNPRSRGGSDPAGRGHVVKCNGFNPRSRGGSDCNTHNLLISHLFDNSKRESYCFLKNQLQIVKERHKTFKNSNILALLRTRHTDYAFKPVTHKAKIKPCIKAGSRFAHTLNNQRAFQIKGFFGSNMLNPVSPI